MDRAKVRKKLVTAALVLLVFVAGAAEAGMLQALPTDRGWMAALWDDLGRALGRLGETWGRSETVPPNEEPQPDAASDPEEGNEASLDTRSEMSPMIDPDG